MKQFAVAILLVAAMTLAGCGSSNNNSGNINGNWTAALQDANGVPVFAFTTSLTAANSGSTVTVTNLNFTTNSCSFTAATETASFVLSGNFNGNVSGSFQLNLSSGAPSNDSLVLTGTVNGGTISGSWTASGTTNCSTSGTFTMTKV
jgi:hypothetical protein